MYSKKTLISGGSGLVGNALSQKLLEENHHVAWLSRSSKQTNKSITAYKWQVEKGEIDEKAVNDTDYIIHLAGAGVADENWSEHRKQEILESRLLSTKLLYQAVEKATIRPKVIIAAAAIGYYGADTGNICLDESSPLGDGFLADVCRQWEIEIKKFENLGVRTVILRLGIVLSEKGGAYEKMILPIKIGLGAALGTGKQVLSWIHIDDLVNMIVFSLQNERIEGIFNAVAPNPVNNEEFNRIASKVLNRPFWLPNVPSFLLELILGERSSIVLGGNKVSSKKIKDAGFRFQFEELDAAIKNLSTK